MIDLKEKSGLPIKLEDIGLAYDQEIFPAEPSTRTYNDAKDVYVSKSAKNQDLYYMYRYFESEDDGLKMEAAGLEYDITVINNGFIGKEFIKTVGHYHSLVPEAQMTYPEVYEVINGKVDYLLQSMPDDKGNVDLVLIEAVAGDKVIIPPNWGHVSINVGEDVAISSNIQKRDLPASSNYEVFKDKKGAALFRVKTGWDNNPSYKIKSIRKVSPKEKPEWGITFSKPLYISCLEDPSRFRFLVLPQYFDFSDVWEEKTG